MSYKEISVEKAWNLILDGIGNKTKEFHTVPKTKKQPVWFSAIINGRNIIIDKAQNNEPSSKISTKRRLDLDNFKKVYPLSIRRKLGESVSSEATEATRNQVYYFSLIEHLVFYKFNNRSEE